MSKLWNEMYAWDEYVYWEKPNDFFAENISWLNPWKILLVADWEWRNWVFAWKKWWDVFCFDLSDVWRDKALKLAEKNNANINYIISDFKNLDYMENIFDCIVLTYAHFINHKEQEFQKYLEKYLKVSWTVILEWFSKKHLWRQWWPKNIEMLFDIDILKNDFKNFEITNLEEKKIILDEWKWHSWESIVIRFIWKKK